MTMKVGSSYASDAAYAKKRAADKKTGGTMSSLSEKFSDDKFFERAKEKSFDSVKLSGKTSAEQLKKAETGSPEKKAELLELMAEIKDFQAAEFDGELKAWKPEDSNISAEELAERMDKIKTTSRASESPESKDVNGEEKTEGADDKAKNDEEKPSGKVAFNGEKRARQLAAASSPEQVRIVMNMLNKDLSDCEMGVSNGMCDENEVAKVKAMLQRAEQRMGEVSGNKESEQEKGIDEFALSMLI